MAGPEKNVPAPTRDITSLPGNSHAQKLAEAPPRREVKKVTKGTVKKRKPSLGKRIAKSEFSEQASDAGNYIIQDIVIPSIKDIFFDIIGNVTGAIQDGVEMALFGEALGRRRSNSRGRYGSSRYDHTSYDRMFDGRKSERRRENRDVSRSSRSRHDFDELVFDRKSDAKEILIELKEILEDYGAVRVWDFYQAAGVSPSHVDQKWGWEDLNLAEVTGSARDGYIIDLPRPKVLE